MRAGGVTDAVVTSSLLESVRMIPKFGNFFSLLFYILFIYKCMMLCIC